MNLLVLREKEKQYTPGVVFLYASLPHSTRPSFHPGHRARKPTSGPSGPSGDPDRPERDPVLINPGP